MEICVFVEVFFFILKEVFLLWVILVSNMEMVVNVVWDSGVSLGDWVLVVGFGMIGGLLAWILLCMLGV